MNKKPHLIFCLILMVCHTIWAQETFQNYKFSSLGVNEGLSQNSVWNVLQTHDGFLWIGTSDGINRYDGTNFKVYKHEEGNACTITGQNFPRFYEDKNKVLWVSDDKGICVYNKEKDCFKNVYHLKKAPMIYYSNGFIGEDKNNGLIIYTADDIILRFDINTQQITKKVIVPPNQLLSKVNITSSPITIDYTAYFTLNDKLLMELDLTTLNQKIYTHDIALSRALIQYSSTQLLFITNDTLCFFDIKTKQKTYTKIKEGIKPLNNYKPGQVIKYEGNYWFIGEDGLYIFNPKTLQFVHHFKKFSSENEEDYNMVFSTYVDHSNNLWICTNGDGLKMFSPYKNKFVHYKTNSKKANLVKGICATSNGLLFTVPYHQPIQVFDEKTGSNTALNILKKEIENIGTISCITPISNNRIALIYKNNLYTYNYITKKTDHLINEKEVTFLKDTFAIINSYSSFLRISPTKLFANMAGQILQLEFLPNGKLKYNSIYKSNHYSNTTIAFDHNGKLWIGAMSGITIFDTATKKSSTVLNNVYIKSILKAKNGFMYVATQSGLFVLQNEMVLTHYTIKNGLPADFTYGILEDKNGRIWISHNKGLSCFDPIKKNFKNFTINDGLQSSEFNTGAYYKAENGKLYFGGINGVNVFDPDAIISNPHLPQVQFTAIKLFEEPLKIADNVSVINQIQLPYFNNTLSFDFAALEFSNSQLNQYAYKLEGYDKDWIYSGNKHYSRYANLPFGNYVFKVKAANADEVWNEEPKTLTLVILPPFWRTYWFYILAVLLSLTLIGLGLFYFLNQQKIKLKRRLEIQQKLEQERLRISRDLHDNVGAQLSYLITNVEWMLQQPNQINEEEVQERLKALSETGRNAIITLRETIWAISSTSLNVEDFTDRFKQFALKMIEFNSAIHVHFSENFTTNNTLSPAVALNLFRVCQEGFNNCLKHAICTEINIHFGSDNQQIFTFKITDNGKGFDWDEANQKGHYGLVNMQARAKETGAELSFQSELGKGTTLLLSLYRKT